MVGSDAGEIEARRSLAAERLSDCALALDESGVGLEQLDLCAGSEVDTQGDERFETGDSAAGDDDAGHAVES